MIKFGFLPFGDRLQWRISEDSRASIDFGERVKTSFILEKVQTQSCGHVDNCFLATLEVVDVDSDITSPSTSSLISPWRH